MRVVLAGRIQRYAVKRKACREHRCEAGEPLGEIAVGLRVSDCAAEVRLLPEGGERNELTPQRVGLRRDGGGLAQVRIGPRGPFAERADRLEHASLDFAPDTGRPEGVVVRPG